ncbi:WD repeat-containing protein 34-like [Vespa mandarinia]|uniref:WD repeat-containing protein 34-like n=1 Tax=Vespa mandarinia TaxID=7446 RepID=UPI00162011DB|nr:WD repeat-containing protein 34-like [Vespa mandarinia]XP_035733831.1 WD repeat-containing protein 34-like [Vespa mandarinia]
MFRNESFDTVGFESQVSVAKPEVSENVQTTEIVYSSNQVQTTERKNAETQTVQEQTKTPNIDYNKLANFLKRVTPSVLEALDEIHNTNAFEDYDTKTTKNTSVNLQLLKRLNTVEESDKQTKISDLSWSIAGGTLVVSHSVVYHETWCDHLSKIQLYSLSREDKLSDISNKTLEVNSCVTVLSYHPVEPSILAAGLFNGDVLVWNLRNDDSVTPIQVYSHGDTVSQIYWKPRTVNDVSILVSSSKDGYIIVNKLMANFTTTRLHKRFKIIKEHNPIENSRPRSAGGTRERAVEAGLCITSFDFSWKDPNIFIVGTLCGGIYKCSLDRMSFIEGDESLSDPVIDEYDRHEGSITCVKCSPNRNLFVTCGTDKDIRIYDLDQNVSQQSISLESTVIGLTWIIGNPDIFATFGAGNAIKFYNVTNGKAVTNIKVEVISEASISNISLNSKRDILGIGDVQGRLEIWKVPRQLF